MTDQTPNDETGTDDAPNEILAAVQAHARVAEQAIKHKAKTWPITSFGIGLGIGSAAIAAAVLFTRRRGD